MQINPSSAARLQLQLDTVQSTNVFWFFDRNLPSFKPIWPQSSITTGTGREHATKNCLALSQKETEIYLAKYSNTDRTICHRQDRKNNYAFLGRRWNTCWMTRPFYKTPWHKSNNLENKGQENMHGKNWTDDTTITKHQDFDMSICQSKGYQHSPATFFCHWHLSSLFTAAKCGSCTYPVT